MERKMHGDNIPPIVITKEHGSWAVLFVPMIVNAYVAGRWSNDFILVILAALAAFLAYVPAQVLLRHYVDVPQQVERFRQAKFWGMVYAGVTIVAGVALLIKGYVVLLVIGAAGGISFLTNFFFVMYYSKRIATDLIAVAGLTLGGPSVYYVLMGILDRTEFFLYLLNLLFFCCSVFYVHMKIQFSAAKKSGMAWRESVRFGKLNLLCLASVASCVGILAALHCIPIVAFTAFVPMIVHGIYGTVNLSHRVQFKKLGFILLGHSMMFGTLLCFAPWK
jgi:YwiC-like protein